MCLLDSPCADSPASSDRARCRRPAVCLRSGRGPARAACHCGAVAGRGVGRGHPASRRPGSADVGRGAPGFARLRRAAHQQPWRLEGAGLDRRTLHVHGPRARRRLGLPRTVLLHPSQHPRPVHARPAVRDRLSGCGQRGWRHSRRIAIGRHHRDQRTLRSSRYRGWRDLSWRRRQRLRRCRPRRHCPHVHRGTADAPAGFCRVRRRGGGPSRRGMRSSSRAWCRSIALR